MPFPWSGYLRRTGQNLTQITRFLKSLDPDIIGLVEVDGGSFRSSKRNQAKLIADELGHEHSYKSKYHESAYLAHRIPILNKQGNAFLTRDTIHNEQFHYFDRGVKRLIMELELEHLTIFLVHLALGARVRHDQLSELYELVKNTDKPHIVAGDFNAMWGDREIRLFLGATGLINADPAHMPTFPSWMPKRQLDFILHSPDLHTQHFWSSPVTFSDHLPLIYDFVMKDGSRLEEGQEKR